MQTTRATRPFFALLTVCLLLTGCQSYQPKPLDPSVTAGQLDSRQLDSPEIKQFLETQSGVSLAQWPPAVWTLDQLTLVAFHYNPELETARAQWAVAEATIKTAGGRPNPTLSLSPEYNFSASGGVTPWLPGVSLDIPLETAGKRGHRLAEARHKALAARLNLATAAWQLRSSLRTALLELQSAGQKAAQLDQQLRLQASMLHSLQQRKAAGALAGSELQPATIQLAQSRLELQNALGLQLDSKAKVAALLGVPLKALQNFHYKIDYQIKDMAELTAPSLRTRALHARTDILAALAEYAAAQASLQLEIAKQYPDIHLSPGYQWDQGDSKWHVGLSADLPVLNQNQGPIAEASARREEAAARFMAMQSKALNDIDHATARLQLAQAQLDDSRKLLEARKTTLNTLNQQRQAGAIDPLEIQNAQLDTSATTLLLLESQAQWQQAVAALEDALQSSLLPGHEFNLQAMSAQPVKKETHK